MAAPQPGITATTQNHHYALEYTVATETGAETIRSQISLAHLFLRELTGVDHVVAFGPALSEVLCISLPELPFNRFETIAGKDNKMARATQHDLLFWIQGGNRDLVFDAAMQVNRVLTGVFVRAMEVSGFIRAESRDLMGFIDGSANPKDDLIAKTAFVPDLHVGAGGSFVLSQKWRHDLPAFNALGVPEQESIIGRTKDDSIELEGDDMPSDSHVSRTDVSIDGETQRIYRRSFPYGTLDDHGLYFLAFALEQRRFDVQLRRMFGDTEDGIRDRITDFSTAISGSYFFAPSMDSLKDALT